MHAAALVLYAAAAAAYLVHFCAARPARRPRSRPALLGGGVLAHTFLIGMQTMEAGYAPLVGHDRGGVGVRLAARAGLPLRRADHRRARDGRVRHACCSRRSTDPAGAQPGDRAAAGAAAQPAVHGPRAVDAVRLRQLRARLRARHHLRAAVQGDQGQASRVLLRPAAVAADARRDERPRGRRRLAVPDARAGRRRHLGDADPRLDRSARAGDVGRPIRRSSSRCCRGACTRSRCSRGARSAGAAAAPPGCRRSASSIVLLNFVPVGYFLTRSHNF